MEALTDGRMTKESHPITQGIRFLRRKQIAFTPHLYLYKPHGGTGNAAAQLGIPEHNIIKTLVMETDEGKTLLVLMHGDCEVSTKQLARCLHAKEVHPCRQEDAQRKTGYAIGGISPFGTRTTLDVCVQSTIFQLDRMLINAGKRGFLVEIAPEDLRKAFPLREAAVALQRQQSV